MKFKKYLFIIAVYMLGVFMPNYVSAETLYIGQEEIETGQTKNIYGGTVKFEEESSNFILTLKDVTIDEYISFSPDTAHGIYFEDDLTIKLEGDNKIKFENDDKSLIESYYGIYSSGYTLNVIGNGTLRFDCKIYEGYIYGMLAENINIGNDSNKVNIYANLQQVNEELKQEDVMAILMCGQNDININNAYIKGNIRASLGFFLWPTNNLSIKKSNLDLIGKAAQELDFAFSYYGIMDIEDSDISLKGFKADDSDIYMSGLVAYQGINIDDSRIVIFYENPDPTKNFSIMSNYGSPKPLNLIHKDGKDFLIVVNAPMDDLEINLDGITNKMVYVSNTSLDTVKQSDTYDLNNLLNEKYFMFKSNTIETNNDLIEGNNQKLKENNITSYSFLTNHYKGFVKSIKLGDQELDTDDYLLSLDGRVSFTDSGLKKLCELSLGSYKIDIDYIYGNSISVNFEIVENTIEETNVDIPETGDNIYISILLGLISIISFALIYLRKRKISN